MTTRSPRPFGLTREFLDRVFPFWFAFDREMKIVANGPSLAKLVPTLAPGSDLAVAFKLVRPNLDYDFERWVEAQERLFILEEASRGAVMRGQLLHGPDEDVALLVGAPWLTDVEQMEEFGLTLGDFSLNNPIVDLLHLFQAERRLLAETQALTVKLEARGREQNELNQELIERNERLQEAEGRYREAAAREQAILENALEAIITIDERGIVISCNSATETLFGFPRSEVVGSNISMLMPRPHADVHDNYIRAYLETGQARVIGSSRETLAQRKDGTIFPIELSVGEVKLSDHRLFTGIVRDITLRKTAELEARRFLAELESSRENLSAALNLMHDGAVIVDQDDRVLFLNDACPVEPALDRSSRIGSPWYDVLPLDDTSRQRVRDLLRRPEAERTREPLTSRLLDGRRFHLEGEVRDFPGDAARRILFLNDISELHELKRRLSSVTAGSMVGESEPMQELYTKIREVSAGEWTVLIEGETGSGKELVARAIHSASGRGGGPFIPVNCAGLSESLLSSQLFGHVRGAFTGALSNQEGVFEAASGGTLFLDEIGDIPLSMQSALLRVLQEREIVRVGEARPRKVNVRILAATHRDLNEEVVAGRFRQDLLFRLRVARVRVPPLRERREDILLLASAFLAECRVSTGKPISAISSEAGVLLERYSWPGNVRELRSTIESAAIHCQSSAIQVRDLPLEVTTPVAAQQPSFPRVSASGDERSRILEAMRICKGHRGKAATLLGMSRATLYRKIVALGLGPKSER